MDGVPAHDVHASRRPVHSYDKEAQTQTTRMIIRPLRGDLGRKRPTHRSVEAEIFSPWKLSTITGVEFKVSTFQKCNERKLTIEDHSHWFFPFCCWGLDHRVWTKLQRSKKMIIYVSQSKHQADAEQERSFLPAAVRTINTSNKINLEPFQQVIFPSCLSTPKACRTSGTPGGFGNFPQYLPTPTRGWINWIIHSREDWWPFPWSRSHCCRLSVKTSSRKTSAYMKELTLMIIHDLSVPPKSCGSP